MFNSRRLFRLFKSFKEYHTILELMKNKPEDEFAHYFTLINKFMAIFHWFFDNLSVLSDFSLFFIDSKKLSTIGAKFRFFGLLFAYVLSIRNLIHTSHREMTMEKALLVCDETDMDKNKAELKHIREKKDRDIMNLVATACDLLIVIRIGKITKKIWKLELNDGVMGACGLISALIGGYKLYSQELIYQYDNF